MLCELLLAGTLFTAVDVHVVPLERPAQSGKLVEFDARKLVIEADGAQTSYDVAELISVTCPAASAAKTAPGVVVWLIDGSELACKSYTVEGSKAVITLRDGGGDGPPETVDIPTASIDGVRFRPPDAALAAQWTTIAEAEATGDRIVIRRNATVNGAMVVSLDTLEGVIYDVTDETVRFALEGSRISVNREKLEGVFYFHAAGRPEDPVCRVWDAAGSRWNVRSVALDGDSVELVGTTGARVSLPLERLMKLDFSIGKILYLSDAEPESVEWTPFIGPASQYEIKLYAPRNDVGWGGAKLEIPGAEVKLFEKGLQVFSRTELVYRVPEGFKRFLATAGIDNGSRPGSNVRLVITGDGDKLLEQVVTRGDQPLKIDLDLIGVRRMMLLIDYGKGGPICDHLNLGNARITK